MPRIKSIAKRSLNIVVLLSAVLILNFFLLHLAPGDPAEVIAGDMGGATLELLAEIRTLYGLDLPLHEQLGNYLSRVIQGDLGYSYSYNLPVTELILGRLFPTLLLVLSAMFLSITVGTLMGVLSARKPNSLFSHVLTFVSLAGYSAPVFWTGIMLLIVFASIWPIFPVSGMQDIFRDPGIINNILDIALHLVLPVVTLSMIYLAQYSRLSRVSMMDVLGSDYIRTARAKGLSETTVLFKHALRNAALPVITMAGLQFSNLFAGAVLVETVFNWPGMGSLAFESILRRDSPTMLGILFFSSLIVVIANLLTDFAYGLVDPRIQKKD